MVTPKPEALLIPRQPDRAVIKCFKELSKLSKDSVLSLKPFGIERQEVESNGESNILNSLHAQNSTNILSFTLRMKGFTVAYYRNGRVSTNNSPLPYNDEVVFTPGKECALSDSDILTVIQTTSKHLNKISNHLNSISSAESFAQNQHVLERLEELNTQLLEQTHTYRAKLDEESQLRARELEDRYKQKLQDLEESAKALAVREEELESQDNRHARRDLRKKILEAIRDRQDKFQLSSKTQKMRTPIRLALLMIFALLGMLLINEIYHPQFVESNSWISFVKQIGLTSGALASLIFLVKWENKWFQRHADAEFELKKLELDIERASWLVETGLDWYDAQERNMPAQLIDRLSANLFTNEKKGTKEDFTHPADYLASALLGTASSLKIKTGDSEIQLDPKRLRKTKLKENSDNRSTEK